MLLAGIAVSLAALSGCTRFGGAKGPVEETTPGVPVETAPAILGTMAETVTVTGTIRASREASIGAQMSAQVLDVKVREGDHVAAGQVLISLDPTQAQAQARQARAGVEAERARLQAAQRRLEVLELGARSEERAIARSRLEQAESALRTAKADLDRLQGLFEKGAVSKQQLDDAQVYYDTARTNRDSAKQSLELTEKGARPEEVEAARKDAEAAAAGLDQAKGMLAEAQERLGYATIRSPLAGIVVSRSVEPGEIVSMGGDPLLRVADPSSVYYEAQIPERVALRVKPGQRVDVIVQGDGDRKVKARVERVVQVADPSRRDFLMRISIVEGAELMKPGMFARGAVVVQETSGAVVVPKDALVERDGKLLAFVVEGGKVVQRELQVGITDAEQAQVLSGLKPGDSVVVVGAQGLRDGDLVQPKELKPAGGA
jgi:RND family efflux transporter MFP subunit